MAKVRLNECVQDSQDYGSDDEHMISRVFFDVESEEKTHNGCYVAIKQAVGGTFEENPIEVGRPQNLPIRLNYEQFRAEIERYFRSLVGGQGSGIRIEGATNIRMRNNRFRRPKIVEIEIATGDQSW